MDVKVFVLKRDEDPVRKFMKMVDDKRVMDRINDFSEIVRDFKDFDLHVVYYLFLFEVWTDPELSKAFTESCADAGTVSERADMAEKTVWDTIMKHVKSSEDDGK